MKKIGIFLAIIASVSIIAFACKKKEVVYHDTGYKDTPVKQDIRNRLFNEMRNDLLTNCTLKHYGSKNDGGYLMCDNLLKNGQIAYSYGIEGRDEWGCEISKKLKIPVHQYDCFDTRRPVCNEGTFIFHAECIGDRPAKLENRQYDSLASQIIKNKDMGKKLIVKMDVEGSEWDSLLSTRDDVLNNIEQLAIEFHNVDDEKYIRVFSKLKKIFYIANVHFNNCACSREIKPFPATAFEVLFVNKRIGTIDKTKKQAALPTSNPLDQPNHPGVGDCQAQ
jgi:hypothetical protein